MENNTVISEFVNPIQSSVKLELLEFLAKQGIRWDVFESAHKPVCNAHIRQENSLARRP